MLDGLAGGEGAEVTPAVLLEAPRGIDAGPLLVDRHLDVGEALVVLQADVVVRAVLLDEVELQDKGFLLGAGDEVVYVRDARHHPLCLGRVLGSGLEIGADTAGQVHGLAHVHDGLAGVLHEVDAGLVGQPLDERFDAGIGHGSVLLSPSF